METKITRILDGMLEICWLTAIILTPLFFNIYSSRIFEPDKITLLRTLALMMLIAWIIKLVDSKQMGQYLLNIKNLWRNLKTIPLFAPVLGLAVVYLLATLFSITPTTSLWGSYQRLQGTYTTLSYLVIFLVMVSNIKKKAQIERMITVIILTSLPISLYGVLQRYKIDPIPWGGDTSARIASNMGNSIFVAAYLIMVFPLVLGRILISFREILLDKGQLISNFTRATIYVFIGSLQVIALYFSGSRGPTLGFLTGSFVLFLILSALWRKRQLIFSVIIIAVLGATFLIVLNIKNGPLENLRNSPAIGRFGQLLDPQSNNARVRAYIWKGTVKLVAPHKPLEFPDGRVDIFNVIRPLIGYGPESMYVAYNPFYPSELTQVEKRNASPDRSHNETWDSLVITGILGFLIYLSLFGSVIYYGFKWLGFIGQDRRNLFLGLFIAGGIISSLVFVLWRGISYIGVALPFGMVVGAILYLAFITIVGAYQTPREDSEKSRSILLAVLLSAIVAHWMEINFGIAIASTRLYFWVFSALLILIGYRSFILNGEGLSEPGEGLNQTNKKNPTESVVKKSLRKKRRYDTNRPGSRRQQLPDWMWEAITLGVIVSIILATMGYEYISATQGGNSALAIVWNSLSKLKNVYSGISYGVMAMVLTTWLAGILLVNSEVEYEVKESDWLKRLGILAGVSLFLGGAYWLWHAGTLARLIAIQPSILSEVLIQVKRYESLLSVFYCYIFLLILLGAYSLFHPFNFRNYAYSSWQAIMAIFLSLIIIPFLTVTTNLRIIQADVAFKLAEPFNNEKGWPVAIEIYKHAIDLAPSEDYYYLFLGRAYLENAKTLDNSVDRDVLISNAEKDLLTAQSINPLNTDHTANLARLYSLWSVMADNPVLKKERAEKSSYYFSKAVTLSPNNSRLWDEWALLDLNSLSDPGKALEKLLHSEALDPYYDWTQALLGEYYVKMADVFTDTTQKQDALVQALSYYGEAMKLADDVNAQANYSLAQAQLAIDSKQYTVAISALINAIKLTPESSEQWKYEQTLAQLYAQTGDKLNALAHASRALQIAPDDQKANIQTLLNQVRTLP